jgi:hypothetical protein
VNVVLSAKKKKMSMIFFQGTEAGRPELARSCQPGAEFFCLLGKNFVSGHKPALETLRELDINILPKKQKM